MKKKFSFYFLRGGSYLPLMQIQRGFLLSVHSIMTEFNYLTVNKVFELSYCQRVFYIRNHKVTNKRSNTQWRNGPELKSKTIRLLLFIFTTFKRIATMQVSHYKQPFF